MKKTTALEAVEAVKTMINYMIDEQQLMGKYEAAIALAEANLRILDLKADLIEEEILSNRESL